MEAMDRMEGMKTAAQPSSRHRATHRRTRRVVTAALLFTGLAFALPGQARPGRGHQDWGGPGGWIERHAETLGIDEATLAEINQIVDGSREQAKAIYAEHRTASDAMRKLLDQDEPDVDAVMKQADVLGEIDVRKHKHRIATMLAIRAKLTSEQRTQLRKLKDEMHERTGDRGKEGHHRRGGHGRDDDEPGEDL